MNTTQTGVVTAPSVDADALELALEQAFNAIDVQRDRLQDFRSRTATLLGAAAIGGGFVTSVNTEADAPISEGWGGLALAAFVVQFLASIVVLWPHEFIFSRRPDWMVEKVLDGHWSNERFRAKLLRDSVGHCSENDKSIGRISFAFVVSVMAFAVAVLCSVTAFVIR